VAEYLRVFRHAGFFLVRGNEDKREKQMTLIEVVLAIFLPPVAAFMKVGLGLHFWLNIVLTLLGGLPGMIHALWLVARDRQPA
jgi:uncharacterized membrane protein YqaE (UPF0057 family)